MNRPSSSRARIAFALVVSAVVAFGFFSFWPTAPLTDDQAADDAFTEITDATLSVDASGCGLCQESGLCDHAFRGSPGHFCLPLVSGLPCCCPPNADCVLSTTSRCLCRHVTTTTTTTRTRTHQDAVEDIVAFFVLCMMVTLLVSLCITACRPPPRPRTRGSQYGSVNTDSNNVYSASSLDGFATGVAVGSTTGGHGHAVATTTTTITTIQGDAGGSFFSGDGGGGSSFAGDW